MIRLSLTEMLYFRDEFEAILTECPIGSFKDRAAAAIEVIDEAIQKRRDEVQEELMDNAKETCGRCSGKGRYLIGPRATDYTRCNDCAGSGYVLLSHSEKRRGTMEVSEMSLVDRAALPPAQPTCLTDAEVAAVHLGKVRLENSTSVKQVTLEDGSKRYEPIEPEDRNAQMTCAAVNVLEGLLAPYNYRFGDNLGTELVQ